MNSTIPYLHDIPLEEAQSILKQALIKAGLWGILGVETIVLNEQAVGRVLAEPLWAKISSPHYHAAAMDGFALRAADTTGALPNQPVVLRCDKTEASRNAVYINTGDPLPPWADAVVPIENIEPLDDGGELSKNPRNPYAIRLRSACPPWSHVRPLGEDIVATQLVLPAGHILRPVDLGAAAACGHNNLRVTRKPRVAIIPTGSELVPVGHPVKTGEIIEFNSIVLAGQINAWGGLAQRYPITNDSIQEIQERVHTAASENDLVLLNAGSSAGSADFSATVIESLGQLLVHGVAVRPGHPVVIGMVKNPSTSSHQKSNTPVIGVPGYPVSAALTNEIFIEPLLARWLGRQPIEPVVVRAALTRKVTSPPGDDDYLRMALGYVGDKLLAAPLPRGSGVITSLVRADGITILPHGSQGAPAGAEVEVRLYSSLNDLRRTIFAIGSHDLTLDLIAQSLAQKERRLISANVGSLAGLLAIRRGEAHLAGSHLLDPETGEYNLSYIRQYCAGTPVKVFSLVDRLQGLMVSRGNPKGIHDLVDLVRPDIIFVNRQRGAGTRVLLDYHLGQLNLDASKVRGYDFEEYTHLAVAAAIASGRANCGLGISAAAQALDLDFIPLYREKYQLVIPSETVDSLLLEPFFEVLNDPEFKAAVASMPGYEITEMGKLAAEIS